MDEFEKKKREKAAVAVESEPQAGKPAAPSGRTLSRRAFLKAAGATGAGLVGASVLAGCEVVEAPDTGVPFRPGMSSANLPVQIQYPAVPYPPAEPPDPVLKFFTMDEARLVDALTARILPGTPEDPGARQAGVVYYIDNFLSFYEGFNEPTYFTPPFAQPYDPEDPPPGLEANHTVVWVPKDELERYGYQSRLTPREVMRVGLGYVEGYTMQKFNQKYSDLSEQEQDSIIEDLINGTATGFESFSSRSFFLVLRRLTAEGMFSDPAYGGNRDFSGWRLVGYPGAQRAYLPSEIATEGAATRPPQGLAGLHVFSSGQPHPHPNIIEAVRGVGEEPPEGNLSGVGR